VHAQVRSFQWLDLEMGHDPGDSTLLVIVAGPSDGPGEETFHATVCTPAALQRQVATDGVVVGLHFLFVDAINTRRVEDFLRARIQTISGDTWAEVGAKIGRLGFWEFEDYRP
jgi:hypothetical protein